ncbi:S8 family serine peptidase [Actinopolymorpha sp. B17G11]|uniref:S8 family serine peptidase n=1 Tax=Actinopolymorpha sp. B17G11 TaxID=3160861 RepID=UPI0032E39813
MNAVVRRTPINRRAGLRFGTAVAAAATAVALLCSMTVASATPAPGDRGPGVVAGGNAALVGSAATPDATTVTLVTGDRLVVRTDEAGRHSAVVSSPDPDPAGYLTRQVGDELYVVPASAAPLLADGTLDERLFNVTGLVEQGYDDAHSDGIPLIATAADPRSGGDVPAPAGSRRTRPLPSIAASALVVDKEDSRRFWRDFADPRDRSARSINRLWLDAKVQPTLDRSVHQIGATEAWSAGFDGTGTKVAVLDSGYDPNHPDLAGRIAATANFTDRPDAFDEDGHGTHVASIVGGNGSASAGVRKGVAPGAELLVGRVLGWAGGQESWVIAGMEWAVGQGADVVNMSLGSSAPADCTDPVAAAAKRLTEQTTTLFVIAAGNTGVREGVTSPGCVPGALTVGAVDRDGETANFSARGPVLGNHAPKPDLAAPGVAIMAAALDSRGDNHYTPMSGTSMAAPHVAGAAAILAQRRPDLTAQHRKALLVSAAAPNAKDDIDAQGAGVVDVPRALRQTVLGPGPTSLASFTWPHTGSDPVTTSLSFTNIGDRPVTLDLSLEVAGQDGGPAPRGMVELGARTLTVPARGSAAVPVTLDPRTRVDDAAYGEFGGRLVGRASDGTVVTTPVGFWVEPETVDLTVRTLDRQGNRATGTGFLDVLNVDAPGGWRVYPDGKDDTFRVRAGTYSIAALITTRDPGTAATGLVASATYAGRPEITVDRDTTLVLDAREGRGLEVDGDRPLELRGGAMLYGRWASDWVVSGGYLANASVEDLFAVPDSHQVGKGHFELGTYLRMYAPDVRMRIAGRGGARIDPAPMAWGELLDGEATAEVVDVGDGTPEALEAAGVRDKVALIHLPTPTATRISTLLRDAAAAGARAVLVGRDSPGRWRWTARPSFVNGVRVPAAPGLTLTPEDEQLLRERLAAADGPVRLSWSAVADSPYVYNLAYFDKDRIGSDRTHTVYASDLGRVHETWYAPGDRSLGYADLPIAHRPWTGGAVAYVGDVNQVRTPQERDVYYTPGDTGWEQIVTANVIWGAVVYDRVRTFTRGDSLRTTWFKHPMQTGVRVADDGTHLHVAERQGNLVGFEFPHWQDADPDHMGPRAGFGDTGGLKLHRNGVLVGQSSFGAFGQAAVEEPAADYRLEVTTARPFAGSSSYPDWRLSLRTETTFTFRSGRPPGEDTVALPILLPDYDVPLDAYNRAPATADFPVRLTFEGQADYDPGAVGEVSAWASYDDGETWSAAPVTVGEGSAWVAHVDNRPGAGGYVTLKVAATDSHGNGVEQVVERAYAVK